MKRTSIAATMGVVASLGFLCGAARAWEEPDAVYSKYHHAVMSGNAEEMLRLTVSARRAELAPRMDVELRQQHASMPAAYALERKTVSRDGQSARLYFSASGEAFSTPKAGAQYGIARMVLEGGEWRLADQSWAREKPAEIAPARAQAPESGRVRDMTRPRAGQGRPDAPLLSRVARPDCSYKPVMSDEEIERCR
jgi:hypothetical protein